MKNYTLNYSDHRAFANIANTLSLPDEYIDEFNFYYSLAEHRKNLSKSIFLAEHLRYLLQKIFDSLEKSVSEDDNNLKLFLKEMYVNSSQLLVRDLYDKILYDDHQLRICKLNVNHNQSHTKTHISASQMLSSKCFNGVISESTLSTLQSIAKPMIAEFRNNYLKGKTRREELSANGGESISRIASIVNTEFEKNGVNQAVSIYCARPMKVGGLALELSIPTATWWKDNYGCYENSPKTLYMHTDESISIPKAIIYLSDVLEENGAFSTVANALDIISPSPIQFLLGRIIGCVGRDPDSALYSYYKHCYHQPFLCNNYRKHFMSLPKELQYNSHFGWDVIPNSLLEKVLLEQETIHTGKAGYYTVFDGSKLVHRGGLVKSGERIALQVCFSPITVTTLKTKLVSKAKSLIKRLRKP